MPAHQKHTPEEMLSVHYKAYATASLFHKSGAFVRGLMGPVGGGKTVANIMEMYTRALEQEPRNGVRRTRWALIRNTYPELLSTTLKTFEEWIPSSVCPITRGVPIGGTLNVHLPDGTRVDAEFIFLALDSEDDSKKLKSLELTGAFVNEASEIRETVIQLLTTRVGRFPKTVVDANDKVLFGPTWHGVIMDTNPPDDSHWWYRLAEVEKPKGYAFFQQPPALIKLVKKSPDGKDTPPEYVPNDGSQGLLPAENIPHLPGGFDYYFNQLGGKDPEWIKVFIQGEYGTIVTGKPVYPEYSDQVHLSKIELEPFRGVPVLLCYDFGLTPACSIMQQTPRGQLRVLDELVSEDMGIERFARDVVKPFLLSERYQGCQFFGVGDPAGGARSQADETTCFQILDRLGLPVSPAPSNSFQIRREAVAWFLTKMTDGEPGFLLSPTCKALRKGFISGYHYRRMKVTGSDRYAETPDKNGFSHIHDSVQYGCSYMRSASLDSSVNAFGAVDNRRAVVPSKSGGWA